MQQIIQQFDERVEEVDLYFSFLEKLDDPDASLYFPNKRKNKTERVSTDLFTMLKATAFLVIYNLVESTIREAILLVYRELELKGHTYESICRELRDIWIHYHFRDVFDPTANWDSYRLKATDLVEMAMNRAVIVMDRRAIRVSGNLDANEIRRVCRSHGISTKTHYRADGGAKLLTVKVQRNNLAHGNFSFSEIGRQYTIGDLKMIKGQSVIFLRSILRNVKDYVDNEHYAVANVP